jgi:glutaredoxin 3
VAASDGAKAAIEAERWLRLTYGSTGRGRIQTGEIADTDPAADKGEGPLADRFGRAARHDRFDDWTKDKDDKNPEDCDLTSATCIETIVSRHPVVVFSKPWCPHCRRAIEALALDGVEDPYVIDLSQLDAQQIQSTLEQMTGRRTVPNVFIGGSTIGGGDETVALERRGKLREMLQSVGATS